MGRNKRAKTGGEGSNLLQKQRREAEDRARADAEERDDEEFIPLDKRSLVATVDENSSEEEDEEIFDLAQDDEESLSSSGEESSDESSVVVSRH